MITVTNQQLERLRRIRNAFVDTPKIPPPDAWRRASNNDVWIQTISQVVVVGRADRAERLREKDIRCKVSWQLLCSMTTRAARKAVWRVLRRVGARYVARNPDVCRKTTAIVRNLDYLKSYSGGPKGFLADVAALRGTSSNCIEFIKTRLHYIKDKGARDFLTSGFGVLRNNIALDTRVLGALQHVGVRIPSDALRDSESYAELERDLINQVCRPLRINGSELDQLLFRNYKNIKADQW